MASRSQLAVWAACRLGLGSTSLRVFTGELHGKSPLASGEETLMTETEVGSGVSCTSNGGLNLSGLILTSALALVAEQRTYDPQSMAHNSEEAFEIVCAVSTVHQVTASVIAKKTTLRMYGDIELLIKTWPATQHYIPVCRERKEYLFITKIKRKTNNMLTAVVRAVIYRSVRLL